MALNIYEPMRFSSQGIDDLATQTSLTVTNGRISVDIVEPKKEIIFSATSLEEAEGKGIKWSDGRRSKGITLKNGNFFSDLSVNLFEDKEYQINDTTVLSFSELGTTVTKSNLKQVGTLKTLKVAGSTELGEFVYVNSNLNRVGINTDSPRMALSIQDNTVELGFGSNSNRSGVIGTFSNNSFEIVSDSIPRIILNTNGEIKINGTLIVDQLVTDAHPLMIFKETAAHTNYGRGLMYAQLRTPNKQFVLHSSPDRFWSTENIDLDTGKFFSIENSLVLSKDTLGESVIHSSLKKLGVLYELQVAGDAAISRRLLTNQIEVGKFVITENKLSATSNFSITRNNVEDLVINDNIEIGNANNRTRTVSLHGKVSIGSVNPDPTVSLTVNGSVSFDNKKFKVGSGIPTDGTYSKGDIVWNNDPKSSDYIGWVCIVPGTPGAWLPFGAIASK
jgi:hypothetical protein